MQTILVLHDGISDEVLRIVAASLVAVLLVAARHGEVPKDVAAAVDLAMSPSKPDTTHNNTNTTQLHVVYRYASPTTNLNAASTAEMNSAR
jgi:hypothetical protein